MARNQALQMTINQEEWALAWKIYGQVVQGMALVPAPAWTAGSAVIDPGKLSDTTPAIVLLGWYDARNKGNGGHFIVASRVVSSGRVVFLVFCSHQRIPKSA